MIFVFATKDFCAVWRERGLGGALLAQLTEFHALMDWLSALCALA